VSVLTVPALLRQQAASRRDDVLLACDDDHLSYEAADVRSAALAKGLLTAGASKGTRVAVLHPNGSDFVVAWLATARIGGITVPLSTFSTSSELATLLRGADVALVLSAAGYRSHDYVEALGSAAASVPTLRRVVFPGDVDAFVEAGAAIGDDVLRAAEDAVTPADRMVIVHTSGSTSEPKGVLHTHGGLLRHLTGLNELRRYTPDEVLFSNSPFFWIGGFAYALLGTLLAGARLVCSNAVEAAAVLDVLERERPTMVNGFAASVAHLPADPSFAGRDLSSIRRGNLFPIMPADVRPADPELRHAMLGMTEAGSVCLASEDEGDQPEHRRGSFGKPVPGIEARVVDGQLELRGPSMMEGYDGRERHEVFDPDGWYRTGDLVEVDADGFFSFKGRAGDMIKTAGANVSPREVEAAILDVSGLVAHVVGIDDDARGQVVAAAVRVPAGADVDAADLRTRLRDRLSAYKVPKRLVLLADDEVPLLSSGKLDQRRLQEILRAARAGPARQDAAP
jgi:acyl-CoA synthetase (AMP-forming)/AMP-acid ligase II